MSYSIIRVQKMNRQAIKGIQIHNQREKDSETNPDIRKEDFSLNYDLIHGTKKIDYNQKIQQVISENVKSDKKIRKDAVLVSEFLITSDTDFFDKLSSDDQKRYFETAKDFITDRYGQQNVIYATVHNDEKTPHMHVGIVPVTEDGRLSAKEVIGNRMQLVKLQDAFNAHVKAHGFDLERGLSRSGRKHVDMAKFKQLTAFEAEKEAIANYEQTVSNIREIGEKTKMLEDLPDPTRMLGRVVVKNEDYEALINYATTGAVAEVEVRDLEQKLAEKKQEIVQLKTDMQKGQDELRKNYVGIDYRNEEIKVNLEELANEKAEIKAQSLFDEADLVKQNVHLLAKYKDMTKKHNEMVARHNDVAIKYNNLLPEKKQLQEKNQELKKENKSLQEQIKKIQQELEALKERAMLALERQFQRVKSLLSAMNIESSKLKTVEKAGEKIVSASIHDMEKPKKPQKTMEMER